MDMAEHLNFYRAISFYGGIAIALIGVVMAIAANKASKIEDVLKAKAEKNEATSGTLQTTDTPRKLLDPSDQVTIRLGTNTSEILAQRLIEGYRPLANFGS